MGKISTNATLIFLFFSALVFQSCEESKSDIGRLLYKETKNKIYQNVDSVQYNLIFKQVLLQSEKQLDSTGVIKGFYGKKSNTAFFIKQFASEKKLRQLLKYYGNAPLHGLNPELFDHAKLKGLLDTLYAPNKVKTVDEAYKIIARVELLTAASLIKYTNALQYGTVNPQKTFSRYYMKTARPDSVSMAKVFDISDLKSYLEHIQPQDKAYKKLQAALHQGYVYPGLNKAETEKIIKLNLERLRWKNKNNDDRYVWVNIPDFALTYYVHGKSELTMKVCVGKAKSPAKSDVDYDSPQNHETPILSSTIHTIVVNPTWGIPPSIALKETMVAAMRNPGYLSKRNIKVYYKGKSIPSDSIDWSTKQKSLFQFVQDPGAGNALGKIKFLFNNSSSVYLHDTPSKGTFNRDNRAVSHGCVRVQQPLTLAKTIVRSEGLSHAIETAFNQSGSRYFNIQDKIPVYLDYMTCWVDANGTIQIRPDVYSLDRILYRKMAKFMA